MRWLALLMLLACEQVPPTAFVRLSEARQLVAASELDLARGAEAVTRVVMQDASGRTTVSEARGALGHDLTKLAPLLHALSYEPESALLTRLRTELAQDRKLEDQLLALTGEGSNVAAQQLSFGAAHDAVDRFHEAAPQALAAAYALRSIEALEGPHIAEADEGTMTQLEQRMARYEADARAATPHEAQAALNDFFTAHARILALSRRNTNVHALSLAVGDKRAAHDASARTLHELRERLQARTFPATR
ncbi:MAG TPA: hypothetical protein VFX59_04950 [Polyangiales bacterium]|nr:hypothetical protein [Polyangiales bacterium]